MPRFRAKIYVDAFRLCIDEIPDWFVERGFKITNVEATGIVVLTLVATLKSSDIICHVGDYLYFDMNGCFQYQKEEEFKKLYTEEKIKVVKPKSKKIIPAEAFRIGIDETPEWFKKMHYKALYCDIMDPTFIQITHPKWAGVICHEGDYVHLDKNGNIDALTIKAISRK